MHIHAMSSIPKFIVGLLVLGFIYTNRWSRLWDTPDTFSNSPAIESSVEFKLMRRAYEATNAEDRNQLLAELEKLPVDGYPFYLRWLLVNEIDPRACWTDTGYDPTQSDLTPEVQWLEVTNRGVSDIDNGGLLQFFENDNGTFAPEMVQWFEQAGLAGAAGALQKAMAMFGPEYPRSSEKRITWLEGKSEDLFDALDGDFLTEIDRKYDAAADKWIRERCGIQNLSDPPPKVSSK
jgi:hypothetical protein